jgi:phage terminase large subunit-like protein
MSPKWRREWARTLSNDTIRALYFLWDFWAREEQKLPAGDWQTWLILAGRGFGKTRLGAETVREWVKSFRFVNIIAPTADDARDIMVEGESGILAICPPSERPTYRPSKSRLEWPNGARSLILTADEPDRIRGKQHEKLWADEVAAWRYAESWDQAMLGLRIGSKPQAVVTTTPRPIAIIRELMADRNTLVTRGTTYDNRPNLSPTFYAKVITKYEGTRLGRQELNAEVLDDNPRALWQRDNIDRNRVSVAPVELSRIVVGLDPNVKNRDRAELAKSADILDEAGIVVAGRSFAPDGVAHFYVLGDYSLDEGPNEWGKAAAKAYADHKADRIIGEINNGGDMVEATIRAVDANVSYKSVTASRGKAIRAEPIAALYEQGRVHHVGSFGALEDEMCNFDPITTTKSPNRMDALVWALTELSAEESTGMLDFMRSKALQQQSGPTQVYPVPTDVTGFPH